MVKSCLSPRSSGDGLVQGSIGFKKISELTADEKAEYDLMNVVRIAKAKLAAVQRKNSAPAAPVRVPVARLSAEAKLARERELAAARQRKRRAIKKVAKGPVIVVAVTDRAEPCACALLRVHQKNYGWLVV